jgi:uncharacterized protein
VIPPPPFDPHRGFRPRTFRAAAWLGGPNRQTVLGKFLRARTPLLRGRLADPPGRRERVETPDGDFLDLDLGPDPGPSAPVVLLLHGLEGSTERGYMRLASSELGGRGLLAVGMNFRSCSGEPNRKPRFYHSGETSDVAFVLGELRARYPGRPLGALGFSLGGNALLKLLADAPGIVEAAAVVSVPFDLAEGTRELERSPMGRVYTHYFLRSLLRKADTKAGLLRPLLDFDRLRRARTLREFDDAATAPLHGFDSAWDYYDRSSSGPRIPELRTPTLVLHSLDDPFLPKAAVPVRALEDNPFTLAALVSAGGHVGFVEASSPGAPSFWAEAEAARYLAALLAPGPALGAGPGSAPELPSGGG